jgi:methyl-accepting chemotaxis protein
MRDEIRRQLSGAAQVITLPTMVTRNVVRASEAILEIRDQLRTLADLPREVLEQMRAMQEVAERMHETARELQAIAEPMLESARGIHAIAEPMLNTGQSATRAAEEARDAVLRTNELIERTLEVAWPLEEIARRGERLRERLAQRRSGATDPERPAAPEALEP